MSATTQKFIESLQELKQVDYSLPEIALKSNAKAERVLYLLFEIGSKKINSTAEDKEKISALIVDAIEPIQINIEKLACLHKTRLERSILKKRSALQFLVDDYGNLPVKGTFLSKEFARAKLQDTISILDDIINELGADSDSEGSRFESNYNLPSSHTWWST